MSSSENDNNEIENTYNPFVGLDVDSSLTHLVEEVSTEEKRAILDHIEQVVSERRSKVSAETQPLKPNRKGYRYPIFVNVFTLLLLAVVTISTLVYFQMRESQIATETSQYFSTEGKILATFKRESEQKLRQKDATIVRILQKLRGLNDKQSEMQRIMEINLQEKEKELERALAAELELERQRLAAANMSKEEIALALREREAIKKLEKEQEFSEYKRESEDLLRQRQRELITEQDITREVLGQASLDRQELLKDIKEREEKLRKRELELEEEARQKILSAEIKIKRINELREKESLVTDQINSFYFSIIEKLETRDYSSALRELDELKGILHDESLMDFPMIMKRRNVDLTVVNHFVKDVQRLSVARSSGSGRQVEADTAQKEELERLRKELHSSNDEVARLKRELLGASADKIDDTILERTAREVREGVLREVLWYAEYLETLSEDDRSTKGRSAIRDKNDVLFVSVIDAIISLGAARQTLVSSSSSKYRIIGTVSLVTQDQIIIEKLTNLSVASGSQVEVRRAIGSGELTPIARCTVAKVSGDRIIAKIDRVFGPALSPEVMDRVYIRVQS